LGQARGGIDELAKGIVEIAFGREATLRHQSAESAGAMCKTAFARKFAGRTERRSQGAPIFNRLKS